ncbi:molybdate ABC transporter substrate-binding protein, partial [Aeromonas veronii]|nr:molybdate ABC transporter substrate-binding protein [Aeromonas veronii]
FMYKFILLLFLALFLYGCGPQGTDQESTKEVELTVSAATSMQNVLQELKNNFEKEHPTIDIAFNFGSSGSLAQQISQGAPVDLFLSASVEKFEVLVDEGLINDKLQQNLIGNEIVLIAPKENVKQITAIEDLKTKAERISIGIPESVPAGKYAKEALESQGIWKEFYEQDRIVFAKDVRQVLTY